MLQCAHAIVSLILQIDDQRRGGYVLCMIPQIVYNQDNLCEARIDHQIYYSESVYILFLQAESVIGPGSF